MQRSARRSSTSTTGVSAPRQTDARRVFGGAPLPCQTEAMSQQGTVRVGLVGTSWWAEAMYLPALADHPIGRITAICGRDLDRARSVANAWSIPKAYNDWTAL